MPDTQQGSSRAVAQKEMTRALIVQILRGPTKPQE